MRVGICCPVARDTTSEINCCRAVKRIGAHVAQMVELQLQLQQIPGRTPLSTNLRALVVEETSSHQRSQACNTSAGRSHPVSSKYLARPQQQSNKHQHNNSTFSPLPVAFTTSHHQPSSVMYVNIQAGSLPTNSTHIPPQCSCVHPVPQQCSLPTAVYIAKHTSVALSITRCMARPLPPRSVP